MELSDLNPWWKTGTIGQDTAAFPKREVFVEITPYLSERQVLVITGLRRMGKTVTMHHLIELLLKTQKKEAILYYDFDWLNEPIETILTQHKEITGIDYKKEKVFVFLDEIQKHKGWENEVKLLYDLYKIKFVISGSSSLFIEKKTKESLAGRTYSFQIAPLTFKEYLQLKQADLLKDNPALYKGEIKSALQHYMRIGGFPELLQQYDEPKIDKYVNELIIDRIIYIDIPQVFSIEEPALLRKLLVIISSQPGMITDYEGIADDLKRNRKTISSYVTYLEESFLIKKLYNYSRNLLTSERKSKKLYPTSSAFAFLYNAERGKIIETLVLMNQNFGFFSREGSKEIDFVATSEEKHTPLEVKYLSKKTPPKELKSLWHFMEKQGSERGYLITEDERGEELREGRKICLMPLWQWLLE